MKIAKKYWVQRALEKKLNVIDRDYHKKYWKQYSLKNKSKISEYSKGWYLRNKIRIKELRFKNRAVIRRKAREKYYGDLEKAHRYYYETKRNSPWNIALQSAKRRCNNKNSYGYERYGGRGIRCLLTSGEIRNLWERDVDSDMTCPTLDRINNDGNYEYSNCRFIPKSINCKRRFYSDSELGLS